MKKIITAVVLSLLMILSACSPASLSYLDQVSKTTKWTKYTQEGKITVKIDGKDEKGNKINAEIPIEIKSVNDNMKAKVDLKYGLKSFKENLAKTEGKEVLEGIEIPDEIALTVFTDGTKFIVKKSQILDLAKFFAPGALKDVKEEYVGLETTNTKEDVQTEKIQAYLQSEEFKADMIKLIQDGLDGFKAAKEMKVEKNTYTYEANMEDAVKDIAGAMENIAKNKDKIAPTIVDMANKMGFKEVTADKVKAELAKIDAKSINESIKSEKDLKDAKFKFQTTFGEDSMEQNLSFKFKIDEVGVISVESNSKTVKDDKVKVELPKDAKIFTQEELFGTLGTNVGPMFLVTLNDDVVVFEDAEPFVMENRTFVPFRAILEKAGAKVEWDKEAKKVTAELDGKKVEMTIGNKTILVDGKEVELDVAPMIKDNRTYIPLRGAFEGLGFKVEFEKDDNLYSIDMKKEK